MSNPHRRPGSKEIFETMPVPSALAKMALPTIASQLVALIYNIADTWFIGQTDNPYMVAASSLVLTLFLMTVALANLFGVGGGTLTVRLLGLQNEEEARKVASLSLVMAGSISLLFSLLCLIFMDPLLYLLGSSSNTIVYARQYLFFVVVLGAVPTVLSNTMSTMIRNIGYSKEAGFGLSFGGVLNVILDPIFMFVLLPDGYQVVGAAMATLISNLVVLLYFVVTYRRLSRSTILALPRRIERIGRNSMASIFSIGLPAALGVLLFDMTNIVLNRLASTHGDIELAAIGIVLKAERLPLNVGIGICLGMAPLVAYNFASGDQKRMRAFFKAARLAGLVISLASVVMYRFSAPYIMQAFIDDPETVRLGTAFLKARCVATPLMFLSFHMFHFMQAMNQGKCSFFMAVIRHLLLNIPTQLMMNHLFGVQGIVWAQTMADTINVCVSYLIYFYTMRNLFPSSQASDQTGAG